MAFRSAAIANLSSAGPQSCKERRIALLRHLAAVAQTSHKVAMHVLQERYGGCAERILATHYHSVQTSRGSVAIATY